MNIFIFGIVAFLVLVYVYSFLKIRRKKRLENNSEVLEFKKKYYQYHLKNSDSRQAKDSNYNKYITKYNSSVDYISRDN